MSVKRIQLIILFLLFSFHCINISGQDLHKNSIDLKLTYMPNNTSSQQVFIVLPGTNGIFKVENNLGGLGGKIVFNHYISNKFAITLTTGLISTNSVVIIYKTQSNSVIPILLGSKYFPLEILNSSEINPYFQIGVGIIIGTVSGISELNIGTKSMTAFGSYSGIGSDFILGSLIKLTIDIGYYLMSDFNEPVGGRKNYNGIEFSIGFGFMF